MSILFRGRLHSVDFVAQHILGTADFDLGSAGRTEGHDVLVLDRPFVGRIRSKARAAMEVPAWLRQTSVLGTDWAETLRSLPASLRKELSRLLRRESYVARIERSEQSKIHFYDKLYVPYLVRRFGAGAIVRSRHAFLREAKGAVLLELRSGSDLLGATLLRRETRDTLALSKSAMSVEHAGAGQSDLLDYFAILTGQLLGCRKVDFGLSRPHLDDGVLRYKSKWGGRLEPAGGLDKMVCITPLRASPATFGFLSRNGFIEWSAGRFVVRRFCNDAASAAEAAARLNPLTERIGLSALVLASSSSRLSTAEELPTRVELRSTEPDTDSLAAFLALT